MDCGNYNNFVGEAKGQGGGHFRQTQPMQKGFSGTMMQGINIHRVHDVKEVRQAIDIFEKLNEK